jgi:biopolymer transport protein TolR
VGASVGGGRRRRGFTDINITPFVDVVLVLLVVFMVTAPLLTTGLRIDLPEVQAANTPVKDSRLLVTITKDERVLFGDRDVTQRIAETFRESERVQKEQELYIRADKEARYGIVATVVAAARHSGVQSLNLLVQPELEEPGSAATAPAPTEAPTGAADPADPGPPRRRGDAVSAP